MRTCIMSQSRVYVLWVKVEYMYYESKYSTCIMSQSRVYVLWVKV